MMNGLISRYTSELNRQGVCVHYISITSSPISFTCGRSVNNVYPELMTFAYRINIYLSHNSSHQGIHARQTCLSGCLSPSVDD